MDQKQKREYFQEEWIPKTRLGKLVYEGQVTTFDEALKSGLPIKEPGLVSALLPTMVVVLYFIFNEAKLKISTKEIIEEEKSEIVFDIDNR